MDSLQGIGYVSRRCGSEKNKERYNMPDQAVRDVTAAQFAHCIQTLGRQSGQ